MAVIDLLAIKGSTHFMIGFVFGYLLFLMLLVAKIGSVRIAVYAPLISFVTGGWFAAPYLSEVFELGEWVHQVGAAINVFGAYGWLHHNSFALIYLDGLNRVVVICGIIYLMIVLHYIKLIKKLRRRHAC